MEINRKAIWVGTKKYGCWIKGWFAVRNWSTVFWRTWAIFRPRRQWLGVSLIAPTLSAYIVVARDSFSLQLTWDIEHFKLCFISFLSMCVCVCAHAFAPAHGTVSVGPKTVSEPMELEVQVVVNFPVCVLGTELRSSGKVTGLLVAEPSLQPKYWEHFNIPTVSLFLGKDNSPVFQLGLLFSYCGFQSSL